MHAGMFDTQKMIKKVKMQTQALEVDETTGEPICWLELDYRLNEEAAWTPIDDVFNVSPTQEVDFTKLYGVAGKRVQFRFRGYTTDSSKTAVFIAIIIGAVLRVDVKNFYGPFTFRLMDDEAVMGLRERERSANAAESLQVMEDWADASNDSMLLMRSISALCDDQMIFLNMGSRRQIAFKGTADNPYKSDVYVISATMQEA
jgi:hypothetical protein